VSTAVDAKSGGALEFLGTPLGAFIAGFLLTFLILAPCGTRELSLDDLDHLRTFPQANAKLSLLETIKLRHWQSDDEFALWRPIPKVLWRATGATNGRSTSLASMVTSLLAGLCAAGFAAALRSQRLPSWGAALAPLALLHPLASDVLHPLVGQADLLACAGVLGAWACFTRRNSAGYLLGGLCALIGMFSKESAFPAIAAIPVMLLFGAGTRRQRWRGAINVGVVLVVALAVRFGAFYAVFHSANFFEGASPYDIEGVDRRPGSLEGMGRYLFAFIVPTTPHADYAFLREPGPTPYGFVVVGCAAVVGLIASLTLLRPLHANRENAADLRARRLMFGAVAWMFLFLLPYLGFVSYLSVWAGRFAAPALFGFVTALVAAHVLVARRAPRLVPILCVVLALGGGAQLFARSFAWKSPLALWTAETRAEPKNAYAWSALAKILDRQGKREDALVAYKRAAEAWPTWGALHADLAIVHFRDGRNEEGWAALAKAEEVAPTAFTTHLARVYADYAAGRLNDAGGRLAKLIEARPGDAALIDLMQRIQADYRKQQAQ
jgi:hypothetical protein